MQSTTQAPPVSKTMLWAGWIMSTLPALFLLLDAIMKFVKPVKVVEATVKLGYPESVILGLGIVLLACTILYLIPLTAVLGAILLTGYLGGAVASHLRAGDDWFSVLFPTIFGALLWGGLYLRDERLRALLPLRRKLA
jgi:DoxX-like family